MRIVAPASKKGGLCLYPSAVSRLALRGALGLMLLIGAAPNAVFAHETNTQDNVLLNRIQTELRNGDTAKGAQMGEAAVASAPQDASLRAELGNAYLRGGRFESAAAALSDALALGDATERTALGLALAQIAIGQHRAALATLDHGANIAPADLGLALALAGDPGRGIAVLTDAVRDGAASSNLRQNLAYAYALDGRWADATLTAGFDLSPDQVNARLQQWAQSMQSGGERFRIARLLNVPVVADLGMPAALALIAAQPDRIAPELPATPVVAGAPAPTPPVADPVTAPPALTASAAPLRQVTVAAVPALAHRVAIRAHRPSFTSRHFVQLAAYHSRRSAELGKLVLAKRNPLLRGHRLTITQASSHGRSYWRVVMASFDGASATNFCTSLKRHGAACFAYAAKPVMQRHALAVAELPRNHSAR